TTLSLERTSSTLRSARSVASLDQPFLFLLGLKVQSVVGRTGITVGALIIRERLRIELQCDAAPLEGIEGSLFAVAQRANQINALLGHRLNGVVGRVGGINHHLLGVFFEIILDALNCRYQLARIRGALTDAHPDNDLGL